MKSPAWRAALGAAAALLLAATPATTALADDLTPTADGPVPAALFDQAAADGTVRVNVVTQARTDLASADDAGTTVVSYDTLPMVTLRVTTAGLQELNAKAGVVRVTEDVPSPPSLNESTVKIGSDKTAAAGKTGAGTAVAVLDTGVATHHPFLGNRVTTEACFSVNDDTYNATSLCPNGANVQEGAGSADADAGPCATLGTACSHGTHVAGIVAGNGTGITGSPTRGVAPGAQIIALQVFSKVDNEEYCGAGNAPCVLSFTSSQIKALEKVQALKRAGTNVVAANMSLGAGRYTAACAADPRKPVIDSLLSEGVATVVAAGNSGFTDAVAAPGCVSSAITVGSTTDDDQLSSFSNRGPLLDVLAPGTSIVSSVPGGAYGSKNGTSMAAPHVAGALAVLRQAHPTKTVAELETLLKSSGTPITYTGATTPRIDVNAAVTGGTVAPQPDPALPNWDNWNTVPIPDPGVAESSIEVTRDRLAPARLLVEVDVSHSWTGDLDIDLVYPDGATTPLRRASATDNVGEIYQTYEVDASAHQAKGIWKLRVNDKSAGSSGHIVGWTLHFPWFADWTERPIADLGSAESPVVVGSKLGGNAPTNTRVVVDVHHVWRGDLKLELVAPDGRAYLLRAAAPKDSGTEIHETYVVDASASPTRGTWKLRATDTAADGAGSIIGWTLTF
ncbi:S8 family serine peptidase [Streptomyces sp. NPDC020807]|uniref:S8 family serine peptidase n=1 Tax=Streptomyces sp. NPDC020807 TaxID=3155119 RepID=UPI0033FB91F8